MSCNGCRVLRKGCSENCILRPCLQWIESPEAQGHATVFVAKFFGRAGLMSFISAVAESQRPALFQSLLFEACGRTINPVNGAVGLLWTGNWSICQAAVETVLRGGTIRPLPDLLDGTATSLPASDEASEAEVTCTDKWRIKDPNPNSHCRFSTSRSKTSSIKRRRSDDDNNNNNGGTRSVQPPVDLDLRLMPGLFSKSLGVRAEPKRPGTPSLNSEESGTTTCLENNREVDGRDGEKKLLNLFT